MSAGSSVRAAHQVLADLGVSVAVVGALLALGTEAVDHSRERHTPLETVAHRSFELWKAEHCPLCASGVALDKPQG